jgi:hypothetical protein
MAEYEQLIHGIFEGQSCGNHEEGEGTPSDEEDGSSCCCSESATPVSNKKKRRKGGARF